MKERLITIPSKLNNRVTDAIIQYPVKFFQWYFKCKNCKLKQKLHYKMFRSELVVNHLTVTTISRLRDQIGFFIYLSWCS